MGKLYRALSAFLVFFGFFIFLPGIAAGQDSLQAVETAIDSSSTSINVDLVPDNVVRPAGKFNPQGPNINYWGTVGGSLTGEFDEINIDVNNNLFSVHYLEYKEFNGWDIDFSYTYSKPDPEYKELGLLYGRILTDSKRRFYISVSAGISRVVVKDWEVVLVEQREGFFSGSYTYIEYGGYEYTITGYPLKCKIMYRGKYFGVGLDLIANMNPDAYSTAGALHLSIGKLK